MIRPDVRVRLDRIHERVEANRLRDLEAIRNGPPVRNAAVPIPAQRHVFRKRPA